MTRAPLISPPLHKITHIISKSPKHPAAYNLLTVKFNTSSNVKSTVKRAEGTEMFPVAASGIPRTQPSGTYQ